VKRFAVPPDRRRPGRLSDRLGSVSSGGADGVERRRHRLRASDLNLVTAALVAAALILPRLRRGKLGRRAMIEVENLSVVFNPGSPLEKTALIGVDLTIPAGAFVTVIGSNGAASRRCWGPWRATFPPRPAECRSRTST